jgi:predicted secreted acid phosphatase
MPNVSNDAAAFDPVDYYTRQLPLDLARLTELRDELRVRQGALTAVEDAQKDRDAAAVELDTAKSQAAKILADAKAADAKSKAKAADLDAREAALKQSSDEAYNAVTARETTVATRERNVAEQEAAAAAKAEALAADAAKLDAEKIAFNTKVEGFSNLAKQLKV